MSQFVTDTHPLIWHLTQDSRLSSDVQTIFTNADAGLHQIVLPGIILIEMVYLAEKGIVPPLLVYQLFDRLNISEGSYTVAPLDQTVARKMMQNVPKSAVPELADRIITATALSLGLPLITKDHRIQESNLVSTVW